MTRIHGGRAAVPTPDTTVRVRQPEYVRPADVTVRERLLPPGEKNFEAYEKQPPKPRRKSIVVEDTAPPILQTEELKNTYYDPRFGFLSLSKLMRLVKENKIDMNTKQVKAWLEQQPAWQLTKQQTNPVVYSSYWATTPGKEYQFDVMNYTRFVQDNYQYVLCMIDVYSRYVNAVVLTKKDLNLERKDQSKEEKDVPFSNFEPFTGERPKDYIQAFKKMCQENAEVIRKSDEVLPQRTEMGWPETISGDQEFNRRDLIALFKHHGCRKEFFSHPTETHKNPLIERFHRTLALRLQKWRQAQRNVKPEDLSTVPDERKPDSKYWYKVLPEIVAGYNNSYHSTIKAKPIDVFTGKDYNRQVIREVTSTAFKVDDLVRIKLKKKLVEKGDIISFDKHVFKIIELVGKQFLIQRPVLKKDGTPELDKENKPKLITLKKKYYEIAHTYNIPPTEAEVAEAQKAKGHVVGDRVAKKTNPYEAITSLSAEHVLNQRLRNQAAEPKAKQRANKVTKKINKHQQITDLSEGHILKAAETQTKGQPEVRLTRSRTAK
jgi:hypothetical protein